MKAINKIPRGVQVLVVVAILAALVWKFAPANVFYVCIAVAVLAAGGMAALIYRRPRQKTNAEPANDKISNNEGQAESLSDDSQAENDKLPTPAVSYTKFSARSPRPQATEVTATYMRMAALSKSQEEGRNTWKPKSRDVPAPTLLSTPEESETKIGSTEAVEVDETAIAIKEGATENTTGEPSMPIITDVSILSEEDKSQLENAVWYRCENPFCKYTHFLDVHHIIDEKDGGNNKLDNLIVLCSYCHDLAHRNEMPEKEMRDWISNREERFKFKIEWHY